MNSASTHSPRPARICFLIDNLSRAGTESQLLMLLRGLDRSRIQPYLVLLDGAGAASQELEPRGCPTLRLGFRSFFHPSFISTLWQLVRFLRREKTDILQLCFRDSTYFGVLAGTIARVKRIVLTRRNVGHWMTARDRRLMRFCQRFAHATITNCEACRRSVIEQERACPDRVFVIPNGIDLSRFALIPPYQPKRNGELRRVGVVANLRPVKGIDVLIRAAALVSRDFPNVVFSIAGDGDPAPYRQLAEECGVTEKIQFLGPVADIPAFLAGLDVAVLPSRAEGLSNSLLEYMAAGRPIVATAVGGNVEVLANDGGSWLVPPDDTRELGRAILSAFRADDSLAASGSATRQKTASFFSHDSIARQYQELMRKILAE
jgi:L-malate glycosyltransferase